MPKVGDRIEVWWTGDERWLTAVVSAIEVEGSSCVTVTYEVDGEEAATICESIPSAC